MIEPAEITLWRNNYVLKRITASKREREELKQKQDAAKARVISFLRASQIDQHVKTILQNKNIKYRTRPYPPNQLPMDGIIHKNHEPAFLLDHQHSSEFIRQTRVAGLRYSFYIDFDEVVITVTFCQNEDLSVYTLFLVTRENGRYHRIETSDSFVSQPDIKNAFTWLNSWVDQLVHKQYQHVVSIGQ